MDLRPVWKAITEREEAEVATVHRLREQIAALTEQLARAEAELADLATTRRTLTTVTGEPDSTTASTTTVEPAQTVESSQAVEAVAPSSPTYPQILATFTGNEAMRAKDICLALGLDTIPKNTEGLRAKLKRLVTRQVLLETQPGLFTRAPTPAPDPESRR